MRDATLEQLSRVIADPDFHLVVAALGGNVFSTRVVSCWIDVKEKMIVIWKRVGKPKRVTIPFFLDGEVLQVQLSLQEMTKEPIP